MKLKQLILALALLSATVFSAIGIATQPVHASESFSLSPMNEMINLTPGETFESSLTIVNPANSTSDFVYELQIDPFTEDGNGSILAKENGSYTYMKDWIVLSKTEGSIAPNNSETITYKIIVPEDAPAGGQYASIVVGTKEDPTTNNSEDVGVNIHEVLKSVYLIYAEVAGETVRKGKMDNVNVPSFLFSGEIYGSAELKNEGNVHSAATYTLQVFPLFSKEEVYTNAEEPATYWVMPGNTTLVKLSWKETPQMGVFHVIYNVEYEGVKSNVDKYVIVCPIWLLAIIVATVVLLILGFIFGIKRKK